MPRNICRKQLIPQKPTELPKKNFRTAKHYAAKGRDIDIIKLNGSIEIAPILGLSDVIVDIVETGKTLKENDLEVMETIVPISARLIANQAAYQFQYDSIRTLVRSLEEQL